MNVKYAQVDLALQEFDEFIAEHPEFDSWMGNLWGLDIYIYSPSPKSHKKTEDALNEHPWRYHLRVSYTISSGNAGISYRTDNLAEGIHKLIVYMKENADKLEHWGVNTRVDLGTPQDDRI